MAVNNELYPSGPTGPSVVLAWGRYGLTPTILSIKSKSMKSTVWEHVYGLIHSGAAFSVSINMATQQASLVPSYALVTACPLTVLMILLTNPWSESTE